MQSAFGVVEVQVDPLPAVFLRAMPFTGAQITTELGVLPTERMSPFIKAASDDKNHDGALPSTFVHPSRRSMHDKDVTL